MGAIPGSMGVSDLAQTFDCWQQGDKAGARAAFYHFLPLAHWRRPFPLLGAKEVLRRLGVISGAYLRPPADQQMDRQDHGELAELMAWMGPPY